MSSNANQPEGRRGDLLRQLAERLDGGESSGVIVLIVNNDGTHDTFWAGVHADWAYSKLHELANHIKRHAAEQAERGGVYVPPGVVR